MQERGRASQAEMGVSSGLGRRNPLAMIKAPAPQLSEKGEAPLRPLSSLELASASDETCIWQRVGAIHSCNTSRANWTYFGQHFVQNIRLARIGYFPHSSSGSPHWAWLWVLTHFLAMVVHIQLWPSREGSFDPDSGCDVSEADSCLGYNSSFRPCRPTT